MSQTLEVDEILWPAAKQRRLASAAMALAALPERQEVLPLELALVQVELKL